MEEDRLYAAIRDLLTEKRGVSFTELNDFLIKRGILTNSPQDRKRLINLLRTIEIDGIKGAFLVCPLRKKRENSK
ncbi:hypothetical protein [Ectobacillus sp. sgz5001026]|uniref:hypothetical protein n=1 Tax=Ectobacillus sp. sgz5001026 TaxID=3242473 RepID=UPI0036D3E7C9